MISYVVETEGQGLTVRELAGLALVWPELVGVDDGRWVGRRAARRLQFGLHALHGGLSLPRNSSAPFHSR
jgi:hypothetical protein